jgi:hypothetical protein
MGTSGTAVLSLISLTQYRRRVNTSASILTNAPAFLNSLIVQVVEKICFSARPTKLKKPVQYSIAVPVLSHNF